MNRRANSAGSGEGEFVDSTMLATPLISDSRLIHRSDVVMMTREQIEVAVERATKLLQSASAPAAMDEPWFSSLDEETELFDHLASVDSDRASPTDAEWAFIGDEEDPGGLNWLVPLYAGVPVLAALRPSKLLGASRLHGQRRCEHWLAQSGAFQRAVVGSLSITHRSSSDSWARRARSIRPTIKMVKFRKAVIKRGAE